ncbi:unnamed protein product [Linum tenue]|uniref:Uncharacterized protein n=1 Tax=Linum tenue TaxID=586396 RepID=A0AAV0IR15_9ROSI|nr:unnamed protein product [Linum tenue]
MSLQLQNQLLELEAPTDVSQEAEAAAETGSIYALCDNNFFCRLWRYQIAGSPSTEDCDQIRQIEELHEYLDMVEEMVRPGCPQEMLKVALDSISSLSKTLALISSSSAHGKLLLASL